MRSCLGRIARRPLEDSSLAAWIACHARWSVQPSRIPFRLPHFALRGLDVVQAMLA
jgi:hypothetical protein